MASHRLCVDSCLQVSVLSLTDMSKDWPRMFWHDLGSNLHLSTSSDYLHKHDHPPCFPSIILPRLIPPLNLPNLFGSTHRYKNSRPSRYIPSEVISRSCSSESISNTCDTHAELIRLQDIYPRTSTMGTKIEADAFLACCVRHCKEKPQIDWKEVSHELAMSEGGVK